MKILVVEDDAGTCEILMRTLERAGYDVVSAADGTLALDLAGSAGPDLIILDVGLPGIDGFEVCRRIRLDSQVPIVMLTGRDDEDDVMRGFRLGADDYVIKPYSFRVLTARVATVLRRTAEAARQRREDFLRVGGLELDVRGHEVSKDGEPIRLTALEFRLLHILAANAGRVVLHDRLIEFAWGHGDAGPSHLKLRIHHIRRKLGLARDGGPIITGVKGTGYVLRGF